MVYNELKGGGGGAGVQINVGGDRSEIFSKKKWGGGFRLYSEPKSILNNVIYLVSLLNDSRNYVSSIRYRVFAICFP